MCQRTGRHDRSGQTNANGQSIARRENQDCENKSDPSFEAHPPSTDVPAPGQAEPEQNMQEFKDKNRS